MTDTHPGILDRLARYLDKLHFDRAEKCVTVGDETIEYDSAKRLRQELGSALYRHWHSGSVIRPEDRDLHRDFDFEDLLREATPHRTSKTPAVVKSALLDGPLGQHILFDVGHVRLRIPGSEGPSPLPEIGTRTTLELPAIRPGLSPGFFLVNGSAGGNSSAGPVLRVYLHIDESSMAPAVWRAALTYLESLKATYRAKILAKASRYPRRDAMVVYLAEESWHTVDGLVEAVRHLPGLKPDYSLMTCPIADGVAFGWEPRDQRVGWDRMSLGQHRTMVIAHAVAAHLFEDADLHTAVADGFHEANIDPQRPYRNGDSPDWTPVVRGAAS
ncbi:T3SS effector HopA1 family protein [Rhizohabitans arisaemae]|uniref:T3SS effector HopA1 family protein n=1 Tax=Rhizohabitans arisaemae TaxID=2720610 RepID=UPI0024B17D7B|nr:T3SS effector HopA1 family protein [Rhizohabitans arisaemae]